MNFWDSVKDAGSLKNMGLDIGSLSKDLFGDNNVTSSLDAIIDFGSKGASIDEKKAIEAEQMKKKRQEETQILNARNNLSLPVNTTDYKKIGLFAGGIVALLLVLFKLKG